MKAYLLLALIFLVGCVSDKDVQQAEQYKVELQYTQYAQGFANKAQFNDAAQRCEQTHILRSECYLTLVQVMQQKGADIPQTYCDAITTEGINMTKNALAIVYKELDKDLAEELRTQLHPTKQRIATILEIKERCP